MACIWLGYAFEGTSKMIIDESRHTAGNTSGHEPWRSRLS